VLLTREIIYVNDIVTILSSMVSNHI
jgi:hypothetical protein